MRSGEFLLLSGGLGGTVFALILLKHSRMFASPCHWDWWRRRGQGVAWHCDIGISGEGVAWVLRGWRCAMGIWWGRRRVGGGVPQHSVAQHGAA